MGYGKVYKICRFPSIYSSCVAMHEHRLNWHRWWLWWCQDLFSALQTLAILVASGVSLPLLEAPLFVVHDVCQSRQSLMRFSLSAIAPARLCAFLRSNAKGNSSIKPNNITYWAPPAPLCSSKHIKFQALIPPMHNDGMAQHRSSHISYGVISMGICARGCVCMSRRCCCMTLGQQVPSA